MTTTEQSMYDRVGGAPAVKSVIEMFYWLVLRDPQLSSFFSKTNMLNQKQHLAALVTTLLGGPDEYQGRDLAVAHRGLGINNKYFDLVADLLHASLLIHHVPTDIIDALSTILGNVKEEWLNTGVIMEV